MTGAVLFLVGVVCGAVSGLGLGGGSLLMLYLTALAAMDQRAAQGVNLLFFLPTAAASLLLHTKRRLIDWRALLPAIVAAAACGLAGALLAAQLDSGLLRRVYGGLLLILGEKELWRAVSGPACPVGTDPAQPPSNRAIPFCKRRKAPAPKSSLSSK